MGTVSKIRQNIIFSIVTKLVVFAISFAGYPFLWLAIATDVGAMIAVTINSSTLLGRKRKSQDVFTSNAGIVVDTCQRTVVKESKEAGGCTDGCCETTEVVASASDGCAKGCCPAPKKAAADHGHGHGHGAQAQPAASSSDCSKGCCSKKEVASPVAVLAFRVSGEFDESLAADAVQLLDGVVSASFDGNDMI